MRSEDYISVLSSGFRNLAIEILQAKKNPKGSNGARIVLNSRVRKLQAVLLCSWSTWSERLHAL